MSSRARRFLRSTVTLSNLRCLSMAFASVNSAACETARCWLASLSSVRVSLRSSPDAIASNVADDSLFDSRLSEVSAIRCQQRLGVVGHHPVGEQRVCQSRVLTTVLEQNACSTATRSSSRAVSEALPVAT